MSKNLTREIFPLIVRNDLNLISYRDKTNEQMKINSNNANNFNKKVDKKLELDFTSKILLNKTLDEEKVSEYQKSKKNKIKLEDLMIRNRNQSLFKKRILI